MEQRNAELDSKTTAALTAVEEARAEAASKSARLGEARDATERALQQAELERGRAEVLARECKANVARMGAMDEELALVKVSALPTNKLTPIRKITDCPGATNPQRGGQHQPSTHH
jgi:hypothetical protein